MYYNRRATNGIQGQQLVSHVPLNNDQLMSVAPSIFAETAYHDRSPGYTYIPTIDVIDSLRQEGFKPFMVAQSKTRIEDKRGFAKHMVRLRHENHIGSEQTNEIVLVNSHDGTSSYQMFAGVFRAVCANGLVAGHITNDIRTPHRGDVVGNVIEGAYSILNEFDVVDEHIDGMKAVQLDNFARRAFAKAALSLRYDNPDKAPITVDSLLRPYRYEDTSEDLWTTFQVVQEKLIRGGVRGFNQETRKRTRTRAISSISENIKLNKALWTLAEAMRDYTGEIPKTLEVA